MKNAKWLILGLTCVFLCLLLGIFIGRNLTNSYITISTPSDPQSTPSQGSSQADGRIDLNTATLEQLQLLPGVGETIAQRILDHRNEIGRFKAVSELLDVNGIGATKYKELEPYVKVGG